MNSNSTKAWSISEVMERLHVGRTTLYRLINEGALKSFSIGRYRYVSDAELSRYIREREEESAHEDRAAKVAPAVAAMARKRGAPVVAPKAPEANEALNASLSVLDAERRRLVRRARQVSICLRQMAEELDAEFGEQTAAGSSS